MKNSLSKLKPYLLEIIFIVALFSGIGFYLYVKYIERNQIQQEVSLVSLNEQIRLYHQWENSYGNTKEKNPYGEFKTSCYVLETRLGNNFNYDYGTEEVILTKKCERYAEYEKNRATYILEKEADELTKEKREQAEENALDRLNNKSCN